jgi:hypothetical protein
MLALMVEPALAGTPGSTTALIGDKGASVGWVNVVHVVSPPSIPAPGNLLVTVHLFPAWQLRSVEVAVSGALTATGDFTGLPVNRGRNPVPGLFSWKPLVPLGATQYTVVIPVNQTDLDGGANVYFAVHATVTNGLRTIGAWGAGTPFDGAHNGGMWFKVSCTNPI